MNSLFIKTINKFIFTATIFCSLIATSVIADDSETRIVVGMRSAKAVIDELEYMVSELAGRVDSYENNIFPNIDIFLIGVDTEKPIRFDPIFSEKHGMELQPIIPILDLDEFLEDNLDPIGIIPERDRRVKDLYELTGTVFEGWLRVLKDPEYVVIFPRKEAIPKGMDHPAELHRELVKEGFTFFAELDNSISTLEDRLSAFGKMAKNTIEGIQKRPSESMNKHALRKAVLDQQLSMGQQYFVESSGLTLGSHIDREKSAAIFKMLFAALEGTQLEKDITRVIAEPSYFAAIKPADKALLTTRLHFMLNDGITAKLKEVYQLTETVTKEETAENSELSDEGKKSRTNFAGLLNNIMAQSLELNVVDGFLDIVPSGDSNAFLLGVRCKGHTEIDSAIDAVLAGRKEMSLTKDIAEVEGTKLHKLELGEKAPASIKDMYGSGYGTVILGVSEEAFWLGFGDNAEKELSDRIKAVKAASDVQGDGVVFSMDAKLAPLVKSLNGLLNDKDSFIGTHFQEQKSKLLEQKKDSENDEDEEKERPAKEAASNFLTFEWIDKIVGSMDGEDDTVKFEMKVNEKGSIVGNGAAHKGILKAVGMLIADFADENLQ
ncbi:hypothetical protein N8553_02825 [bacterium]|nr:hypothetical protein [bacterium]